jgi:nucleolar MIF4G domain-containing protein 1
VASYEQHRSAVLHPDSPIAEAETIGKECSNLIVLLSELYNFQVISCLLVFDVIREILDEQLTEFDLELLLKVVRSA